MTYAEYLALEAASPVKMQFVDGAAYAMAGGTLAHSQITARLIAALSALLRPGRGRCEVSLPDLGGDLVVDEIYVGMEFASG